MIYKRQIINVFSTYHLTAQKKHVLKFEKKKRNQTGEKKGEVEM